MHEVTAAIENHSMDTVHGVGTCCQILLAVVLSTFWLWKVRNSEAKLESVMKRLDSLEEALSRTSSSGSTTSRSGVQPATPSSPRRLQRSSGGRRSTHLSPARSGDEVLQDLRRTLDMAIIEVSGQNQSPDKYQGTPKSPEHPCQTRHNLQDYQFLFPDDKLQLLVSRSKSAGSDPAPSYRDPDAMYTSPGASIDQEFARSASSASSRRYSMTAMNPTILSSVPAASQARSSSRRKSQVHVSSGSAFYSSQIAAQKVSYMFACVLTDLLDSTFRTLTDGTFATQRLEGRT